MLEVVSEFLKDRYKVNHDLATKLSLQIDNHSVTTNSLKGVLEEADKQRREHIKSALSQLSSFLPADEYIKPKNADDTLKDHLKVSFYAVEFDSESKQERLLPKWRFFPNEREPKTQSFEKNQGAAGKAWAEKEVVVCEQGGEDSEFKEMRTGQKGEYASMACIPAIEDIPAERLSRIYGVLTIDTPVRRGYFQKALKPFWASLFEPVCNLLIYCHETEQVKLAVCKAISDIALSRQADPPGEQL
jgi:hypothetical protein